MKTLRTGRPSLLRPFSFALAALLPAALACGPVTTAPGDGDGDPDPQPDAEPDPQPEPPAGPLARVYAPDPLHNPELTEVVLAVPTSEDGTLTGEYVNALNCLNKAGGAAVFGFASLCVEEKTVFPDEDGNYLQVEPPPTESMEDSFAELQMYHHVNVVHDYFKSAQGLTDLDFPLDAVVNISINFGGTWQSFSNAAFIPQEGFEQFGLPTREYGAIMFGQGDVVDFSYDASVIYHEYTHAVVGTGRLQGAFLDDYGMNNTPGALNEGLADYFASTILDSPDLGAYALGAQGRDLDSPRSCPGNLTTEIHADGKIIGTALWAIRKELGAEVTDRITFQALMGSGPATGLEEYGQLVLDASEDLLDAEQLALVEGILTDQGVVGCDRARTFSTQNFQLTNEGVPHTVEGTQNFNVQLPDGVPGYHQWMLDVPADKVVILGWRQQAGGGFFGGGPVQLGLAIRKGEPVTVNPFGGSLNKDALIDPPELDGEQQFAQLSGSCLPEGGGTLYFTFTNKNAGAAQVISTELTLASTASPNLPVITCD